MPDTERILVFGPPGSGKSYQALKIARHVAPARVYVVDSDDAYPRLLSTEFRDLENVTVYPVASWPEWREALQDVLERIGPGEWLVVDRADMAWEAVQEYYIEQVFGEEPGDYFLQARKEFEQLVRSSPEKRPKNLVVLEGDKDWQTINRVWKQTWLKIVSPKFPGHLYIVVSSSALERRDEQELWDEYGWIGRRPSGQKHIPYQVHTILYFVRQGSEWYVATVKDRGRRSMEREKLVSLPAQYLVRLAGRRRTA